MLTLFLAAALGTEHDLIGAESAFLLIPPACSACAREVRADVPVPRPVVATRWESGRPRLMPKWGRTCRRGGCR